MATSQTHQRKVALITGATSGIGAATADLLARDGWITVISGRREAEGNNVIEGIKAAGGEALFIQSDVNTEEAVKALVQKVLDAYGRLDAAVNNAGIATDAAPFAETSTQAFEAMWTTNVKGVYWCMQQEIGSSQCVKLAEELSSTSPQSRA
jgi:NAD(P)-dependent dehydrogenase (short-subunit alcohol dehydrogenase family)